MSPRKQQHRRIGLGIIVAGLRLLSVVGGLAYVKYYTNMLSMEQVGAFFYLSTLSYLVNALVFVPVDFYMQARLSRATALPSLVIGRLVGVSLLAGLVTCLLLCLPFIAAGRLVWADIPLLYLLAALLYLCSSARNLLNIRGQVVFAAGMVAVESTGRLMAFVIGASLLVPSARLLLSSSIMALAAELTLLLWQARRSLLQSSDTTRLDPPRHIARITGTLSGAAAANAVQLQAFRVLFPASGYVSTSAALGVTSNIGAVAMGACAQVFSQLFSPRLYQTQGAFIGRYVGWSVGMAAAVLAIGLAMSDFLVRRLTQVAYLPYAAAIGVGVVVEAGNLIIGAYGVFLTLHGRSGALFRFQMGGAVISMAGCFVLLAHAPESPLLLGAVIAGSQLLVVPSLALYVFRLQCRLL